MLEEIISKFCNEGKFISDLDGVTQYLENLSLNYEEKSNILMEVFEYNNKMYSLIVEENKKLEKIIARAGTTKERKEIPVIVDEHIDTTNQIELLKFDISSYLKNIKNCEDLELLSGYISSKNSINFFIILKLVEEIYDIKKMLYQDRHNIDDDTKKYFENEIEKLKIKIEYIKKLIDKNVKKHMEADSYEQNKLIFLKTNYGNVCAFVDLKSIPSDYYGNFYNLLESICMGTFKNMKTFIESNSIKGLREVKDDQARIVFDMIGKNTYVIISMFIKKVDNNVAYRAFLANRKDLYDQNKESITSLAFSNEDFLEENVQIKEKIYSMLKKENVIRKGVK